MRRLGQVWIGIIVIFATGWVFPALSWATEDTVLDGEQVIRLEDLREDPADPFGEGTGELTWFKILPATPSFRPLSSRIHAKITSALQFLEIRETPADRARIQATAEKLGFSQTLDALKKVLPIVSPSGAWSRWMKLDEAAQRVQFFRDPDTQAQVDFEVQWAPKDLDLKHAEDGFHQRLLRASRENLRDQPLNGLRIAIDPGHMGSAHWDRMTGKYIRGPEGKSLSEGVLALQTALLLEERFTRMGAEVLLTHRGFNPASEIPYDAFEVRNFGKKIIHESSYSSWFTALVEKFDAGSAALQSAVLENPRIRSLLLEGPKNRAKYFVLGEDLEARSRKIEAFEADIALVIHYDAAPLPQDPQGLSSPRVNGTKVYVVGSQGFTEWASPFARMHAAQTLLDQKAWNASLSLGRSVVSELSEGLGIRYGSHGGGAARLLEPGIFARNLAVSRKVGQRALTYIECLFYNNPTEFELLTQKDHWIEIEGKREPYSNRLLQVVDSIDQGVVEFVRKYAQ